jgi:hypothetical protein
LRNNAGIIHPMSKERWLSDSGDPKLTNKKVLEIRELAMNGQSQYEIAKLYGISQRLVWNIVHRKAWKHI